MPIDPGKQMTQASKTVFLTAGDTPAILYNGERISFRAVIGHVAEFRAAFNNQQVKRIAVFAENRPEWIYAFYAGWANNSTVVPIDFMAMPDEAAYILNDCKPEIIFVSRQCEEKLKSAVKQLEYKIEIIVFEDIPAGSGEAAIRDIHTDDMEKTAAIIYTSGTTGSPKGVMLSFQNLLANIQAVSDEIPIFTSSRTILQLLPLHHIFPLLGTLIAPFYVGAPVAICPSLTSEDILRTLQDNGVNIIIGVPRLYTTIHKGILRKINANFMARRLFRLAEFVGSRKFSKLVFKKVHQRFGGQIDYLVSGGAKLDETVARDFRTLGFEVLEGYGMTEAAPMITFTRPGRVKIGSAGQALPGLELKCVDGEIIARGKNIMKGYFGRPAETAEVLRDGWLHTGDTGYIDAEGRVFLTGRSKEILVLSNGKNINPVEIEEKITAQSEFISEVAVYLKEDILHAAIVPDFIRLRAKGIINIRETFRWDVIDAFNRNMPSYKRIGKFLLLKEALPRTRLGKIQRHKLAEITEPKRREKGESPAPEFEEFVVIRDFLQDRTNQLIHPDDHLEIDLGLDSLDRISFMSFLQATFGLQVDENLFLNHPTVEKLAEYMREKKEYLSVETIKWAEILRDQTHFKLPETWFTQRLIKDFSLVILKMLFKLKTTGKENLPEGPFILAPNHQSFLDGLFVAVFIRHRIMKNTYFFAKARHVRRWWVRALADRNNVIVMDINSELKKALQKLAQALKSGKNVIIFPEGTRTRSGQVGEFKKAFAILSCELNIPVVPVSIQGAFHALPRGKILPRLRKEIKVKFHKPVFPADKDYQSLAQTVQNMLRREIAQAG